MAQPRYQALRIIAVVLKVFAWIVGIGCALGFVGCVIWAALKLQAEPAAIAGILLLYAVLGFIYLYAFAEGIYVFLDIEANTRRSAELLQRQAQQPAPPAPQQP